MSKTWSCVFGAHPDGCHCVSFFGKERVMSDEKRDEKSVNACFVATPVDEQQNQKFFAEHTEGKRIGFTVVVETVNPGEKPVDVRYDADRLESIFRDGDMAPMLSFVSSGRRVTVEGDKVKSIEFHKPKPYYWNGQKLWQGISHCGTCDGQLKHLVKRPV